MKNQVTLFFILFHFILIIFWRGSLWSSLMSIKTQKEPRAGLIGIFKMCIVNRCGFKGNCQHGLLTVKTVRHLALALFLNDNYDNDDAGGEEDKKHGPTNIANFCLRTTLDLSEALVLFNIILHLQYA